MEAQGDEAGVTDKVLLAVGLTFGGGWSAAV